MTEYEKFFNISHDLLCILDHDGYYKKVNPTLLSLLGYSEKELKAHPFPFYVHPDDLQETLHEYEEVTKGQRNKVVKNRFRSKDGQYHWISWSTIIEDKEGVFYSAGQNVTKQKQLEEALQREKQESERRVLAAITQTQEQEREQVSYELHDNINQMLTTVKLLLELCRDERSDPKQLLTRSIHLQQTAIDEIRSLSQQLSAPALGNLSLRDSMRDLTELIAETKQLNIEIDDDGIEDLFLDQYTHLSIYRILQEHLTNVLKHAAATEVQVTFRRSAGALTIKVTDNGRGFDAQTKSTGLGLQNMKAKAMSIQGTFVIESSPGRGTKLLLTVPLQIKNDV